MNRIEIAVQEPYAAQILSGRKTVEGRLNRGRFATVQVGDHVLINDQAGFTITAKHQYTSFREMLEHEGVTRVIPDAADLEAAVQVYYQFYTPEEEREFGVVGLELQKIAWISCFFIFTTSTQKSTI